MKDIPKKITGISTPFGGVSWEPPVDEKKIAQQVIIFLEDRRLVSFIHHVERDRDAIISANMIRDFLTTKLQELNPKSQLYECLQEIRTAAREFVTELEKIISGMEKEDDDYRTSSDPENFTFYGNWEKDGMKCVHKLRRRISPQIIKMETLYKVKIHNEILNYMIFRDE